MNLLKVMVIIFPLKFVVLKPGVECTNLGGVVSLGPPVGLTTLAQAASIATITKVVIIRLLLYFSIKEKAFDLIIQRCKKKALQYMILAFFRMANFTKPRNCLIFLPVDHKH
jgi:hypothetical protein